MSPGVTPWTTARRLSLRSECASLGAHRGSCPSFSVNPTSRQDAKQLGASRGLRARTASGGRGGRSAAAAGTAWHRSVTVTRRGIAITAVHVAAVSDQTGVAGVIVWADHPECSRTVTYTRCIRLGRWLDSTI